MERTYSPNQQTNTFIAINIHPTQIEPKNLFRTDLENELRGFVRIIKLSAPPTGTYTPPTRQRIWCSIHRKRTVKGGCKRTDLRGYNTHKKTITRVPLVITFSRELPNLGRILFKHMWMLHTSERMKHIFPELPIVAFRRDKI